LAFHNLFFPLRRSIKKLKIKHDMMNSVFIQFYATINRTGVMRWLQI
jgi:hypothetical protein